MFHPTWKLHVVVYFWHLSGRTLLIAFPFQSEWDTLLKDVDAQLEKSGPQPLTEGQVMKLDQPLVDARTGKAACLEDLFAPAAASCASEQSSHSQASKASSSSSPAWPPDRTVSSEATCLVLILLRHFA